MAERAQSSSGPASTGSVVLLLRKNRHAACAAASEPDSAGSACSPAATRWAADK
jgi:hypothetical protein